LANNELNYDNYGAALPGNPFFYAIAVANDSGADAALNVTDGPEGTVNNDYIIPDGEMMVIEDLPWKLPLKEPLNSLGTFATRKVAGGGYHITSDRPVTVYQFNPLHYQSGSNFSYTNDASLLLPAHVYRDEYLVISRATTKIDAGLNGSLVRPGYFAIVGPKDGPTTVEITFAAHTLASDMGSNQGYPAMSPGTTATAEIGPYEVLQVLSGEEPGCSNGVACSSYTCCDTPREYDLTGTQIRVIAGPAPAVFSGTVMSFIPFNTWAADHLEQQLFPLETWGQRYLCAHNITQANGEPTFWRVISGSNDNEITFEPASVHNAVTLNKGEFIEFESLGDFEVEGSGRVSVTQFMCGQNYTTPNPPNGDPAMALGVPVEQYRTDYTFLAPGSYVSNYLTVIHKIGAYPTLDGTTVVGDTVEITDVWARTNLAIGAGIHYIESDLPFAITVYGVGNYTSYMYPGGLDLKTVDVEIE
jgi:hypothetical protein